MSISTLRPGLLVSVKTSVLGNVDYLKEDLEKDHVTDEGKRKAVWKTERLIEDPVEHQRATEARSKALTKIRLVCARSAFGLLCAEVDADKLNKAVVEAEEIAREFNATAKLTRVKILVLRGRIAADDVEAVRAINSEISDIMQRMQEGMKNLDVKVIRDAASAAKNVSQMLAPEAAARVRTAIDLARENAKAIVKAGEEAAQEVDIAAIRRIEEARTAFLDFGPQTAIELPREPVRSVDLEPLEM